MPVTPASLRAALAALFSALALWLLVAPQPASANAHCNATPVTLNFGTAQTATGTVNYSCINQNPTATSFTLCLRVGTSSYPGTATQPALQYQGTALNYQVYTDAALTQVWTATNFITRAITIPAGIGQTITGSFNYYARIVPGQTVPLGTYTGQLFNTLLGFRTAVGQPCVANVAPNFQGQDVTINIQATIAATCTLGARNAINFGTQPGLFKRSDAAGSVLLTCPVNRAWTLSFDGGRYLSGTVRRMRSAAGYYVPYAIYRDAARTNAIAVNGTITGTGTGTVQTTTIYGRTEPPTPPPVGTYQDFIVVTLSF